MKKFPKYLLIPVCILFWPFILLAAVLLKINGKYEDLQRLDNDGALYSINYTGNYNHFLVRLPFRFLGGAGCSCFLARNEKGDVLTGRNYDMPHKDRNGKITGLNVVLECHPRGKYASIGVADAFWLSFLGADASSGAPQRSFLTRLLFAFLPWITMDGINEKGLSVSILALDLKPGEQAVKQQEKGKPNAMINAILRNMLDTCATLQEAKTYAASVNARNVFGRDYHLFVTDAEGHSAVFEWRYNQLTITETNAVTNFYVSSDDAEDCYIGGKLKEAFRKPEKKALSYRYGYGHGYGRFNAITDTLERHHVSDSDSCSVLSEKEGMNLLQRVSQSFDGSNLTSNTQYSSLYNNTRRSLRVCLLRNYQKSWYFRLEESAKC